MCNMQVASCKPKAVTLQYSDTVKPRYAVLALAESYCPYIERSLKER